MDGWMDGPIHGWVEASTSGEDDSSRGEDSKDTHIHLHTTNHNSKLHYLLGYFSLVGLNRLECLLGDFQVRMRVYVCVHGWIVCPV